jgi:Domain of unknown function (DUF6089)
MRPERLMLLVCLLCTAGANAQRYFTALEIGVAGGASQYFGDLNPHYGFKEIHPAGGFYARERLNSYIAIKGGAYYTKVGYDDKFSDDQYQRLRNLNFKSDIFEFSVQAEFNFFAYITGDPQHRFTPYLTGGIGGFYYDPYTTYNGVRYYLQPLGTEGQNNGHADRKYSTTSMCFPVGAGIKTWLHRGVNLAAEFSDRLTRTDYIDDVSGTYVGTASFPRNSVAAALQDRSVEVNSTALGRPGKQRGNTASKDQYFMAMVSISFNFTSYKCPSSTFFDDELRVR